MLDYYFNLAANQPASNPEFSILQERLADAGILLDFTFRDGSLGLHVRIKDGNPVPGGMPEVPKGVFGSGTATNPVDPEPPGVDPPSPTDQAGPKPRRGRQPAVPDHDLTLAQVREMQEGGTCLEKIALLIGVSRRTFFRKWAIAQDSCTDPGTPFSKWADR